ncbi:MAG TPA: hydrolase, partial [Microbacterium sp.]|nr:hydrolase [Microbacterium sp.]
MTRMPAPAVPVAIAQFAPSADSEANARQIDRMVDVAADRGASLVVFPEYSSYFVDPFDQTLARHAQPVDGPFIAALQQSAQRTGTVVVAGLIETATNPAKVRNAVVAVGSEGVLAVYRKLHL